MPVQFAASVLQYPLVWATLTILLAPGAIWPVAWFVVAWLTRALAVRGIDRLLALARIGVRGSIPLPRLASAPA